MKMLPMLGLVCLISLIAGEVTVDPEWPTGSPKYCMAKAQKMHPNIDKYMLQVLPGRGWDDLVNEERQFVLEIDYSLCDVNLTQEFLMPNSFSAAFTSKTVRMTTERYIDAINVPSFNKRSPNKSSKLDTIYKSVIGFYARENMEMRIMREWAEAAVIRNSRVYPVLTVWAEENAPLSKKFKKRLEAIARSIQQFQKDLALFDTQLLVRDYGTHVLTRLTLGGGLFKEDYLDRFYLEDSFQTQASVAAKTSMEMYFGLPFTEPRATAFEVSQYTRDWLKFETASRRGGKLTDFTEPISEWIDSVSHSKMVPVDRIGIPLYDIVAQNRKNLPHIPDSTMEELKEMLINTVDLYYRMNTVPGCTDSKHEGYSPLANMMEPSTCNRSSAEEFLFGGVYQTCNVTGSYLNANPCKDLDVNNIATGAKSCPKNYTSALLYTGVLARTDINKSCEHCGLFWQSKCCDIFHHAHAAVSAYWCYANAALKPQQAFFFGGAFTPSTFNRVTGMKNCPTYHTTVRILKNLHICISQETSNKIIELPFGGFFSCSHGNQLIPEASKDCPAGYSKIMVADEMGCGIYYCAHVKKLEPQRLMNLPFVKQPSTFPDPPLNEDNIIYDVEHREWVRAEIYQLELINGLKYGEVAATCVACAGGCMLMCFFLFYYLFRRWQEKEEQKVHGTVIN